MVKIAITGPESTGKSEICQVLARHYKTEWVPEYARTYLNGRTPPYTAEDLDAIACRQKEIEHKFESSDPAMLFYDTETTVLKIWSRHALGFVTETITRLDMESDYDLYLLMDIDLPWEPDPLREHPYLRAYFLEQYKNELEQSGKRYHIISGVGDKRKQNAIDAVDGYIERKK